jgi:hypothetical protein
MNNLGNTEFINDSCGTGPDINIGDRMGAMDIVAALNSYLCDVAILQQQHTLRNNQKSLVVATLIIKTRNKKEMTVSTIKLDEQEKTLTLAIKLRQGLALAKLLVIISLEQKTVRDWPVCQ